MGDVCWGNGVAHRFEYLWFLTKTSNNGIRKLFCTDLLLAYTFGVNIIGMDTIFDCAQPGVVHQRGNIGLIDVH